MSDEDQTDFTPFFTCKLLKEAEFSLDQADFELTQSELVLVSADLEGEGASGKVEFGHVETKYSCQFKKSDVFSSEKPSLLLCIKDNADLIDYTLSNLQEHEVDQQTNIIVIDDRPSNEDVEQVSSRYNCSYLKVSYEKDFSFSMLNNIGAKISKKLGCSKILLWNSDMWAHDAETLPELLRLHDENEAQISGVKLVYPPFRWDEDEGKESAAIPKYFEHKSQTYRGTTQFGGVVFTPSTFKSYCPQHAHRFINPTHPLVNCDKGELAVTGAFMIIDLDWFIEQGGFNPSLPRIYQDIDLCLKADRVLYFGKDKFFYHDESLQTLEQDNADQSMVSDNLLFEKIWPAHSFNILVQR